MATTRSRSAATTSKHADFREEITAKIITALETGTAPWQQPWNGAEGPQNGVTHHLYSGINTVILSLAMMTMDGDKKRDPRWYTFRQVEQIALTTQERQANEKVLADNSNSLVRPDRIHVRKGERGTKVLLWQPTVSTDENGKREITSVLQRTFTVFHASQIEGIPDYVPPKLNIIEAHEKAERIIETSGAKINFGGGEAFYKPIEDYIQMPPKTDFKSMEGYYSTLLHELSHWTGGEKRLNRVQRCGRFSADYAFEELIAEMGSLFIASSAGIPQSETEFQNHASYIDGWLSNLRNDNMYIFKAAAEASKAAGYLLRRAGMAGGSEEMTEMTDGTQIDKADGDADGAGNQDGNQQE